MGKLQQYGKFKKIDFDGQVMCLIIPSIASFVLWDKDYMSAALFITALWQLLSYILTWLVLPKMYESNKRDLYGISIIVMVMISLFVLLIMPQLKEYYFIAMFVTLPITITLYLILTYEELHHIKESKKLENSNVLKKVSISYKKIKKWDLIGQLICLFIPFIIAAITAELFYIFYIYYTVSSWQLLSFIYNWQLVPKQYKSHNRAFYSKVLFVIITVLCIGGISMLINEGVGVTILFITALILLLLSPVLAIWYGIITGEELSLHVVEEEKNTHTDSEIHFI